MSDAARHRPVLPQETLQALRPAPGRILVDATVGLGGHAAALLPRLAPRGRLLGLDLDPRNLDLARARLEEVGGDFVLRHANFAALPALLRELGLDRVDAVLADLGVSSPHIDDPRRGFSYRRTGPLDMRMDPTRGAATAAAALVRDMSEEDLRDALLELGDEEDAPKIARLIAEERARAPILTTLDLTKIVCRARRFTLERAAGAKLHPAARTFQALRMLVNRELPNLERLLAILPDVLRPSGRAAVISFHSGEDRRVKRAFRDGLRAGRYAEISPDPLTASAEERKYNPRSRSAKLRWAARAKETFSP